MRFRFIDAERAGLAMPIFRLCRLLQVSVSGFYAWRNRGPSQRQLDDMVLLAHVRAAFRRSRESYGAERVHHELAENGIEVGRHRVARLMRGNGLSPKRKQKFKKTTDSQHNKAVASNLLDQNFSAEAPNEKWAADISYIWTAQGWLYLAVMLDLYSRRVIGWAVGARMTSDLPLRALNRAIGLRQPGAGVIHHSDRGSQGGFNRGHSGPSSRTFRIRRCALPLSFASASAIASSTVSTAPSAADLLSPILSAMRPTMSDLFIPVLPATVPGGQTTNPAPSHPIPRPFRDPPAPPGPAFPGTVIALQFEGTAADLPVERRLTDKYHAARPVPIPAQADCCPRTTL